MEFKLSDLSYSYPVREGLPRRALDGLSFVIEHGSCLGVVGAEGSGKTTLLHVLDMLLTPTTGTLSINGVRVQARGEHPLRFRSAIGFLFQFPEQQFVAETVRAELLFGIHDLREVSPDAVLSAVGLPPVDFLHRSPFQLSMGEARRVALASLLMKSPEVLLLDEPTVGLDRAGREALLASLIEQQKAGTTLVIASHDLDFVADLATNILILKDGRAIGMGPVGDILCDQVLLALAGYDLPELVLILRNLSAKGVIPRDAFLRPEEIASLIRSGC